MYIYIKLNLSTVISLQFILPEVACIVIASTSLRRYTDIYFDFNTWSNYKIPIDFLFLSNFPLFPCFSVSFFFFF